MFKFSGPTTLGCDLIRKELSIIVFPDGSSEQLHNQFYNENIYTAALKTAVYRIVAYFSPTSIFDKEFKVRIEVCQNQSWICIWNEENDPEYKTAYEALANGKIILLQELVVSFIKG